MNSVKLFSVSLLVGALALGVAPPAAAADPAERPSALAMAGDAVVARPLGLVITTLGTAAFIVSLPFSALGGNVDQAAEALVKGPARETFMRCLGCPASAPKSVPTVD